MRFHHRALGPFNGFTDWGGVTGVGIKRKGDRGLTSDRLGRAEANVDSGEAVAWLWKWKVPQPLPVDASCLGFPEGAGAKPGRRASTTPTMQECFACSPA